MSQYLLIPRQGKGTVSPTHYDLLLNINCYSKIVTGCILWSLYMAQNQANLFGVYMKHVGQDGLRRSGLVIYRLHRVIVWGP